MLEDWMRSYQPEELFDDDGRTASPSLPTLAPKGDRRMGANPHANGGLLLRALRMPDFRDYAVDSAERRAATTAEATRVLGKFLRDVMKLNLRRKQFPRLRPGRNRLEPAGCDVSRQPAKLWMARHCRRST